MIDLFPNETVLLQWVIFMIALVTLHFGIFRPVLRILKERESKTVGEKEKTTRLNQQYEEMCRLCEAKVEESRALGAQKKEEMKRSALLQGEDFLKKARTEGDKRMEEVQRQIERESKEAALRLKEEARGLGRAVAAKILGREV